MMHLGVSVGLLAIIALIAGVPIPISGTMTLVAATPISAVAKPFRGNKEFLMKPSMDDPYRSPRESIASSIANSRPAGARLPNIALSLSVAAIAVPLAVAMLETFNHLPWSYEAAAAGTVIATFTFAILGIGVSVAALVNYRSWKAIAGLLLSIVAMPWGLFVGWCFGMGALAMNGTAWQVL